MNNRFCKVVGHGSSYTETLEPDEDLEQLLCSLKDPAQVGDSNERENVEWNSTESLTKSIRSWTSHVSSHAGSHQAEVEWRPGIVSVGI